MSTQSAGAAIREARLKAGLSQEKLSEGICSALSLSRIENGTAGVSPATFQALMAHAGAASEVFPVFANRTDFDCFYSLKRVKFYVNSWQLKEAYEELEKVESQSFANNKFNYQEWLLLHSRLQSRSGMGNHPQIHDTLLHAIHISRPNIDFGDFRKLLLSLNEIELFIFYAQESLYLGHPDTCLSICTQLDNYLENSKISFLERDRLQIENAVVYAKYLLAIGEYDKVVQVTQMHRDRLVTNSDDTSRFELTFLLGLGYHYLHKENEALLYFRTVFFSAHSIGSCYATICRNYIQDVLHLPLPEDMLTISDIPLTTFPHKKIIDTTILSDGTYDLSSPDAITIGHLIQELRMERSISQQSLCQGLCSKSKLSKIENDVLQPNAILAETLLQRLGISDRVFTFFSNKREATLHELKTQTTLIPLRETERIQHSIGQMEALLTKEDTLYQQYILYKRATLTKDITKRTKLLYQALELTQPDMDYTFSNQNGFSLCELNILTHLCEALVHSSSPLKGIVMYFQMFDYLCQHKGDILAEQRILPVFIMSMVYDLYGEKRFADLCELQPHFLTSSLKGHIYSLGNIYSHYAQALGECGRISEIPLNAFYAYYNLFITNSAYTKDFQEYMRTDWDFQLL